MLHAPGGLSLPARDRVHDHSREEDTWPAFYTALERALREGGPPPVDPADGVVTLEVIDAARRSVAEREIDAA